MAQAPASVDKNSRLQHINEMAFYLSFQINIFLIQLILLFFQDSPEKRQLRERQQGFNFYGFLFYS